MTAPCGASWQFSHYRAHLAPIVERLPWSVSDVDVTGPIGPPVLVAGYNDALRIHPRQVIHVEHGAGQSYPGDARSADHPSYSGTSGWDAALGFVCPSEEVAARWRRRYPDKPAIAVGCPLLDAWHGYRPPTTDRPIVAFTFHWDCGLIPETRSAWPHYQHAMTSIVAQLRSEGFDVIAHAHPRWNNALRPRFDLLDVPYLDTWADVMAQAHLLVADNSSAMYEFAATGRPVVTLNAPWYRRDVDHGMRFWTRWLGAEVDEPGEVVDAVVRAAGDPSHWSTIRQEAVAATYLAVDGRAAQRAADAVQTIVEARS